MPNRLRVLEHGRATGAWNMAVDEALLDVAAAPCTLRFYYWRRPTVSLGYAQPLARGIDAGAAARAGIGWVRRPTGGRSVLHADEMTYALVAPASLPSLRGGVASSYRCIAAGLRDGFARLGIAVEVARSGRAAPPAAKGPCFSARTRYELLIEGRKLVGSAQRRRAGRLLQHGSILLAMPDRRLWSVLGPGAEDARRASIGLDEVVGARPGKRALSAALSGGIAAALGLSAVPGRLSRGEQRIAAGLRRRYRDAVLAPPADRR